ncbi:hypothetical protein VIGAN_06111300 [Vigna angularis var. angularis]|uniref:Uncharacterized protein n=1 Tax=Vigna angularis var. angularis TaxID=157739 RepID=A0A0S3SAZ6_PHAAN|nr:hypothetical protein VIGAN_06111300 [Vigna angularis var. angularis]
MADIPTTSFSVLIDKNWRVLFRFQDVMDVVEEKGYKPHDGDSEKQKAAFRKKDNKTLFIIHQCVADMHFEKIQNVGTAREAWNILVRCHAGGEKIKKVKLQMLRRQYELMQMDDNDKVSEYFNKILSIINQMKDYGEAISDLMIIEKIMRSLPQRFDYIVVAIEESRDQEKLKTGELQSSLEAHEMRILDGNPVRNDDQALKAHHSRNEGKSTKREVEE